MKEININDEKLIIRKANKADAKALIEYLNIIGGESDFLTFRMGQFEKNIDQEEELIEDTLKKENSLLIVAEVNKKVVGCLNFSGGSRLRTAHIGEFGVTVLKEYWGIGIGKELIQYLIRWSKNTGMIRKINLEVRTDNTRGIHLYKEIGFCEEGVIKRAFLINGEFFDSLLMGLLIN
jgi:RimJ/RimL family protein N-acetyltransferase